jgi:hypothetical protein
LAALGVDNSEHIDPYMWLNNTVKEYLPGDKLGFIAYSSLFAVQ